jgi:hypothetical protein
MRDRGGDEGLPHPYVVAKKSAPEFSYRTLKLSDGFYLVRLKRDRAHGKLFPISLQKKLGNQGTNIPGWG